MRQAVTLSILSVMLLACGQALHAAPVLQLYVEGGVFDESTNSWVLVPPGSSQGAPFRLWAVGNVGGPGGRGVIENVRLAVSYSENDLGLVISLSPSRVGGRDLGRFHGFVDPSLPPEAVLDTSVQTTSGVVMTGRDGVVTNGATPLVGNGSPLPADGAFEAGTVWQEFSLGDFVLTDSPVGEFAGSFPTQLYPGAGQINVYEVSVVGGAGARLRFQLYGTTGGPYEITATHASEPEVELLLAPEPATVFVWCLLGLTFAGSAWMYQYFSRWRELEEEEMLAPAPASSAGFPRPLQGPSSEYLWRTLIPFPSAESPRREEGP